MILGEDIKTVKGVLLILKGQEVSGTLLSRLLQFSSSPGIPEPIRVIVPLKNEGHF